MQKKAAILQELFTFNMKAYAKKGLLLRFLSFKSEPHRTPEVWSQTNGMVPENNSILSGSPIGKFWVAVLTGFRAPSSWRSRFTIVNPGSLRPFWVHYSEPGSLSFYAPPSKRLRAVEVSKLPR